MAGETPLVSPAALPVKYLPVCADRPRKMFTWGLLLGKTLSSHVHILDLKGGPFTLYCLQVGAKRPDRRRQVRSAWRKAPGAKRPLCLGLSVSLCFSPSQNTRHFSVFCTNPSTTHSYSRVHHFRPPSHGFQAVNHWAAGLPFTLVQDPASFRSLKQLKSRLGCQLGGLLR
jgi:hypothetical protein